MHTILASNTSSISITKLGAATSKPHRVIGMHFMNPVPVMQLVELSKGMHSSQQVRVCARVVERARVRARVRALGGAHAPK